MPDVLFFPTLLAPNFFLEISPSGLRRLSLLMPLSPSSIGWKFLANKNTYMLWVYWDGLLSPLPSVGNYVVKGFTFCPTFHWVPSLKKENMDNVIYYIRFGIFFLLFFFYIFLRHCIPCPSKQKNVTWGYFPKVYSAFCRIWNVLFWRGMCTTGPFWAANYWVGWPRGF